ncbi:glycosyltransferase [Patescibacteria group bacterium]|nr:glycosyltransferase [Patescibacteria group bacterium]
MKSLKIAQLVPCWSRFTDTEAIGIKAVARDLARGLQMHGHSVTFVAPEGSEFSGMSMIYGGKSLKDQHIPLNSPESLQIQQEYARALLPKLHDFDIVHSHMEHALLPWISELQPSVVSTIHGAGFDNRVQALFQRYQQYTYVALSKAAIRALPYIHFSTVVYNGIHTEEARFTANPQEPAYLGWMGRFSDTKGALDAIGAAKLVGDVLLLVGFEQPGNAEYLNKVKDQEDGAMIRLLDRMIGEEKYSFLGNAKALLFPIHWEEPFGLVMVEAMACGTPVIAYNRGSVSEIVQDGLTGFIVDEDNSDRPGRGNWIIKKQGIEGIVEAIKRVGEINRAVCRNRVKQYFSVDNMVEGYERVYGRVIRATE